MNRTEFIGTNLYYSQEFVDDRNKEINRLNNIINKLEEYLEEEKYRLVWENSNIYENSLGKTRLVNEDIFNEIILIQNKIIALKGENNDK